MIKEAKISSVVSLFPLPQYVVILEDIEKTRLVPIWIGVHEGNAISLEMQGEKFPRPLTHDLLINMLGLLGARIEKIVVSDLKENSYYAIISIKHNGHTLEIDARPSDSLALAVRVHCPIYIDEKVLLKCPVVEGPITKEEVDKFKEVLKSMTPEEFFKNLEEVEPDQKKKEEGEDAGEDDSPEEEDQ